MTPLKDTLEVATPVAEATTVQVSERPKPESGHLRADAVSLDVPVKVHGSRVTDVVRGITPHTEPFEEQTSTMIVFPQGGVLRMTTAVAAGQMVVLTNLKTGHDAICRVIKVRAYAQTQSYVELEFTNRQPGYWGVQFAGDTAEPAKAFVPAPPPPPIVAEAPAEKIESKPASQISWAPAVNLQPQAGKLAEPGVFSSPVKPASPPAERTVPASKPESSFVAIGVQEDVQPAAAATSHQKKVERPSGPVASLSMTELRGDAHLAAPVSTSLGAGVPGEMTDLSDDLAEASQEKAPATFGRLAASASLASASTASRKAFGARFDSTALGVSEEATAAPRNSGPNWFLIATGIAALFVVAAGGAFYFHLWPAANSGARSASMSAPAAPPAALSTSSPAGSYSGQPSASNPVPQTNQPSTNGAAALSGPVVTTRVGDATTSNSEKAPAAERVQPSAPVSPKPVKVMPDMSATLNAHPVSAQRAASDDTDAPLVESGAPSSNGELQGIAASSDVAPPPMPVPAPARTGGDVKPPKLVSTVLPIYPAIARSAGVEGSVVIEASIGPNGNVVSTKVISGQPILRQSALDALRKWKYQPATLNGEPIAVQITVTIQFHK
jgi:periplasmic protein TonB